MIRKEGQENPTEVCNTDGDMAAWMHPEELTNAVRKGTRPLSHLIN